MNARWFDRIIYGGAWKQIRFLIIIVVSLIAFSCLGVHWGSKHKMAPQEEMAAIAGDSVANDSFTESLWNVYNNFVDSGNLVAVNPEDRLWALIISLIGSVVLGGLLISTLSNIIERRVENCRNGLIHYKLSDHIVIIGADAMLPCLIRQLCRKEEKSTLVVQTSKNVNEVRMELFSNLTKEEEKRIVLVHAMRDSKEELRLLCVTDAKEVFILGDSGELDGVEYYHDSMNVDCLNLIGELCKEEKREKPLKCNVLFEYQSTFAVFQFSDIDDDLKEYIDFCPFNFYETWAQKVFVRNACSIREIDYQPLDYEAITDESKKYVHLVIVGMSRMGTALAVEAAHIAHYPNFIHDRKKKTRITFIDEEAMREMNRFKQAYANLFDVSYSTFINTETGFIRKDVPDQKYAHLGTDFIDIEWQFVKGTIESPEVRKLLTGWCEDANALMTIAVCLNLTHHSISSAVYLPRCIYEKEIPVLVQQRITSAIIEKLSGNQRKEKEASNLRFKNLRPYGMLDDCFDLYMADELYAKRVNAVYEKSEGKKILTELPPQEEIDRLWHSKEFKTVKKWSNIYNANAIPTKLRSVGYTKKHWENGKDLNEEQVQLLAEVEHNRWNVEELLLGYRPVTEDEQNAIKQHPALKKIKRDKEYAHYDIRPYTDLSEASKAYDIALTRHLLLIVRK